jgi:hypothetical protein
MRVLKGYRGGAPPVHQRCSTYLACKELRRLQAKCELLGKAEAKTKNPHLDNEGSSFGSTARVTENIT